MSRLRARGLGPLSLAGAAFAVLACSDGGTPTVPDPANIASITVDRADARILVGNELRVVASAFDGSGAPVTNPALDWESSDPSVVTVDGTGLVRAVGAGSATVRAEAGTGEGVVTVAVPEPLGMIGAAGGALSVPGGDVKLQIPPGALSTERPISVADALAESLPDDPRTDELVPGTAWEFGPSGLSFSEPARLTIGYDPGQLPGGVFADQLRIYRASGSGWTEMGGTALQGQQISALVPGFSVYAVGVDPNRAAAVDFTVDCSGLDCQFIDESTDPDGSIEARSWDFGDGATSADASPSHSFGVAGEYTVTLTVTDDGGAIASTSRTVTVSVDAPVASFIADCEDLTCRFTDQSVDGDGSIVARLWNFGDGATSTQTNPSHEYEAGGTYTVTLTVTDDDGLTDDTQQSVEAIDLPGFLPPSAAFTFDCNELACAFTDGSDDLDGAIVTRAWTFGDGATSSATNPSHTYASDGTYSVSLKVTDSDGLFDTETRSVTVSDPPGLPPTADFSVDCSGVSCDFTDASTDPDGNTTIVTRSWDFGDGVTSTQRNPSHEYAGAGDYTVTLTVTDDDGSMDEAEQTVTIVPQLVNGVALTGLSGDAAEKLFFQIDVPSGQSLLRVEISSNMDPIDSDADLHVRFGSPPTTTDYDCRPLLDGDDEACNINGPTAGTWYIGIIGNFGFQGVTLRATYSTQGNDLDFAFDIDIVFDDESALTPQQASAIEAGIRRWSDVLGGDIDGFFADAVTCGGREVEEYIDDVKVFVAVRDIADRDDGAGDRDILAQAGPCWLRPTDTFADPLPAVGLITFDVDDLDALAASGVLTQVASHEMGHVLGIGPTWDLGHYDLIAGPTSMPVHTGQQTTARYLEVGGVGQAPVEPQVMAHWAEGPFGTELMTPVTQTVGRLSTVSVAALDDMGYEVEYGEADPYLLPASSGSATTTSPRLDEGADLSGDTDWMRDHVLVPDGRIMHRSEATFVLSRMKAR